MAKVELVYKYINDIQKIIKRHKGIEAALADYEGEYAIKKCITQIGEAIKNIKDTEILSNNYMY